MKTTKENRLAQEKSPYLAQHQHNPVDWFPWGEEAFAKARSENKPIFLSIGYSTCYWCHVMEQECFEREEVAEALGGFVSVKVDREEHPEVDEIYMEAVIAMTGRGGWPMSVFLTPELKPFWGGTYVPRPQFLALLERIDAIWRESPDQIRAGGQKLLDFLQEEKEPEAVKIAPAEIFRRFLSQCQSRFDPVHGGFGPAPKFPPSMALRFLLRVSSPDQTSPMVERTLEAMACGGLFDQLGGGFHRYSTDEQWLAPHFEKMLYDNALLAQAYLEAFQKHGEQFHAQVARETLDYLLRDMRAPGGAFYAAEDAGPVGREGEFYVWRESELTDLPNFEAFRQIFPIFAEGNFEHHQNILRVNHSGEWLAARSGQVNETRMALLEKRGARKRPHRDDKILCSWNGLAIAAFALGARALDKPSYAEAAETCARWIKQNLWTGTHLRRRSAGGESKYLGTATDYAFLIDGLISLYQTTFRAEWLVWARELQRVLDQEFWDESEGGYFTASSDEPNLIVRKKDRSDGAIPSANSVGLRNLLRLAQYFLEPDLGRRAQTLEKFLLPVLAKMPYGVAEAGQGLFFREGGEKLVVLAGPGAREAAADLGQRFLPHLLVACAEPHSPIPALQGKQSATDQFFLCERGACHAPRPMMDGMRELG